MVKKITKSFIVFLLVIASLFCFAGCKSKEQKEQEQNKEACVVPLNNYFEGLKNRDTEKIKSAFPEFSKLEVTKEELDEMYAEYEKIYGANIKLDYSNSEPVKLTEEQISELETQVNSAQGISEEKDKIDIKEAYSTTVTLKITGDGVEGATQTPTDNTRRAEFYLVKLGENWYIL